MDERQKKVAFIRLEESIIEMLAALHRGDPQKDLYSSRYEGIAKILVDLGIYSAQEIEDFRFDYSNRWDHEIKNLSICTLGLSILLRKYREYGRQCSCGHWEILRGGSNYVWELRYLNSPVLMCNTNLDYFPADKDIRTLDLPTKAFCAISDIVQQEYPECHPSSDFVA